MAIRKGEKTNLDNLIREFRSVIREEAKNINASLAFQNAAQSFFVNLRATLERFPETSELAEDVKAIKEESLKDIEYLIDRAASNMEKNGMEVFLAKNGSEARKYILKKLADVEERTIVKSKSMTLREIGLRRFLEEKGFEVWETDLGDFLVQLVNEEPMHLTTPAAHLTREQIAIIIKEKLGTHRDVSSDVNSIVKSVRDFLREKIERAEVGFSGANAIAANTGSLLIIENEGNARLVTTLPRLHIAVVGVEKIVPTLEDAYKVAEVTWRYAGYEMPAYLDVISSASKTGDIEKKIVRGMHGPEEVLVVLLDNGRVRASKGFLRDALKCLRCGACMYACPIFSELRGRWGNSYMGGIGVLWSAIIGEDFAHHALACLLCSRCAEVCPVGIDSGKIIRELRKMFIEEFLKGSRS